jgi:hypothetical protein
VEYADGTKIVYTYDQVGNRSQVYLVEYTLAVSVVGSGTVTKNPDQPIYSAGTSVTLTAVNGADTFSEWSGDLTGNINPTTVVMDGNKSVIATFVTPTSWLQGWTYRKAVTLSRASGAVTNYQMRLLVGETAGASGENVDCNGHVQADFDDLRFTTSDGTTLLDYWIESITGTTPNQLATIWIEFDSIGTTATTFYMYYGKSDATAYSNGGNTFPFFDDFPGSSLDTGKWPNHSGEVISGGILTLDVSSDSDAGSEDYIFSGTSMTINSAIRMRAKSTQTSGRFRFGPTSARTYFNTGYLYYMGFQNYADGNTYTDVNNNYMVTQNLEAAFDTNYHIWEIQWNTNSAKFYRDTTLLRTYNSNVPSAGASIKPYFRDKGAIDWVLVRKKELTEPSWGSWGAEEAN